MVITQVFRSTTIAARILAAIAVIAIAAGTLGLLVMQQLPAARDLDPVTEPLSKYALTGVGWLFTAAIATLAVGVAAMLTALLLRGLVVAPSVAFLALTACGIGLVAVAAFPDDTAAGGLPTGVGWAHWWGSMAGFVGAPIAATFVARHHHRRGGCSVLPTIARNLATLAGVILLVFLAGMTLQWTTTLPVGRVGGAVERAMTGIELGVALVLSGWAWRNCPCRSGPASVRTAAGAITAGGFGEGGFTAVEFPGGRPSRALHQPARPQRSRSVGSRSPLFQEP